VVDLWKQGLDWRYGQTVFEEQGRSGLFKKAVYRLLKGNL